MALFPASAMELAELSEGPRLGDDDPRPAGRLRLVRRLGSRLGQIVLVTFLVVVITFALIHAVPGDPARMMLGRNATPESLAALRERMGLDQPLLSQFWSMLGDTLRGDLGISIVSGSQPVTSIVLPAFANTLVIVAISVLMSIAAGLTLGLVTGLRRETATDHILSTTMVVLLATPGFLIGFVLLLFALVTGWAPAGGWGEGPLSSFRYVWLPSIALAAMLSPIIGRTLRVSVHHTLSQDFVESAIARGVPMRTLTLRHVLPNSLLPVIGVLGYSVSGLLAGAAVVEVVFNVPGIGLAMMQAVQNRDFPVIQGVALVAALAVITFNVLLDLLFWVVDPRTRQA